MVGKLKGQELEGAGHNVFKFRKWRQINETLCSVHFQLFLQARILALGTVPTHSG